MQTLSRTLRRVRMRSFKQNFTQNALKYFLFGIIGFFILGTLLVFYFSRDLPEPGKIKSNRGSSTVFYDRNDEVLYEMFEDKNRVPVKLKDIPANLRNGTVAIEDKNFYSHKGFSLWGITRGFFTILTRGRFAGGSTLTQQLVKNVLLSQERTLTRKIKELVLAVGIERKFTKDEILEMYLNESPYGGTFWGVQSASKGYFNKDVQDLNLVESAIIAGLPQSPSVYNPISGRQDAYKGRTRSVLRRMREDKYITREQELKAVKDLEKIKFDTGNLSITSPHFVFYVRQLIAEKYGEKVLDEGIKVKTTLDIKVQKNAEKVIATEIKKIKSLNATNGSSIVLDSKTGEILAMVGSYNYNDKDFGRFNTTTALRQPGSAVKPITYATAFEQGYTASSVVMDVDTEFPDQGDKTYRPVNYDGKFRGPVQYRFALANSYNIPAVKILANVGIKNFLQKAYDMGLKDFEPTDKNLKRFGLALTLGGGETTLLDLTSAYSVFARGGEQIDPTAIIEIRDYKDKVIYKAKKPSKRKVLSEEVAFIIGHILSDNIARSEAFGSRSYLNIPGKTVAVKTGTTNDKRDNWTLGWTRDVTVGVWVGNNDNSKMNERIASGLTGASPIWNGIMSNLLRTYKDGILTKPDNVEALQIDAYLGGLPKDGGQLRTEYFVKGTVPTDISSFYKKVKLARGTSKKANEVEIKAGDYDEKEYIIFTESDPVSKDGRNRWQEAIDAWVGQQSDERLKPPSETSSAKSDEVIVSISEPRDQQKVDSNQVRFKARIISLDSIKRVEVFVGNNKIKSYEEDKREIDETIDLGEGTYELKIKATSVKDKTGEAGVRIGIKKEWNYQEPTSAPTAGPTSEPTPTGVIPPP